MSTNDRLRQRIVRLVQHHGISQKVLAMRMGMKPSSFSKWLNAKKRTPISVTALDGYEEWVQELLAELKGAQPEIDSVPIMDPQPPKTSKRRKERRSAARGFRGVASDGPRKSRRVHQR